MFQVYVFFSFDLRAGESRGPQFLTSYTREDQTRWVSCSSFVRMVLEKVPLSILNREDLESTFMQSGRSLPCVLFIT